MRWNQNVVHHQRPVGENIEVSHLDELAKMLRELPPVLVIKVWSSVPVAFQPRKLRWLFKVSMFQTPSEELLQVCEVALDCVG